MQTMSTWSLTNFITLERFFTTRARDKSASNNNKSLQGRIIVIGSEDTRF